MKVELRGITKRFGALVANDSISLTVEPGQIHALLGENGAGKSTLMNVLYGRYRADAGDILLDGRPAHFRGPGDAMAARLGMVHQQFMLVPVFTVAENVALGNEPVKGAGILDLAAARERVRQLGARFGFELDPDAVVGDLPVGLQQRVEIVKALSRDATVLILDEPTSVLTPQETDELMATMRALSAAGTSILFITHKLREVKEVADTITVIRRGRVVGRASPDAPADELAAMMVGRNVQLVVDKSQAQPGETALRVEHLSLVEANGVVALDDVSFSVAKGEILAIAGVQGNGQTELVQALIGLRPPTGGSIRLGGTELVGKSVKQVLDEKVGFLGEDRDKEGVIASLSVADNLVLDVFDRPPFGGAVALHKGAIADHGKKLIDEFDIRASDENAPLGTLSGGNQQKVVVARELSRELRLLIAAQPTRGLDVGSIEFIHRRIVAERDRGTPVLIVSTELDEVAALADRIAVMYRGRIVGIVAPETPREVLGLMMAGGQEAALSGQNQGDGSFGPDPGNGSFAQDPGDGSFGPSTQRNLTTKTRPKEPSP